MAYRINSAKDSKGDEHLFLEKFAQHLQEILAYQQQRGGDLEGAFQAVTGTPWPEGRSVKMSGGRPEMTKDRTFKSVLGKYVAPIAGGAAAAFGIPGLFPGLIGGGASAAPIGSSLIGGAGSTATASGTGLGLAGVGSGAGVTAGLIGEGASSIAPSLAGAVPGFEDSTEVTGSLPESAGGMGVEAAKNLGKGMIKPALIGGGLDALGSTLSSLFSQPSFQPRSGFSGASAPQAMQDKGVAGMGDLLSQLKSRPQMDFSNLQAQSPMEGMDDDPIKTILKGLK